MYGLEKPVKTEKVAIHSQVDAMNIVVWIEI